MLQAISIRSISTLCYSRFQVTAFSTIKTTRRTVGKNIYRTGSSVYNDHNKKNNPFFSLRQLSTTKINSVANEDDVLTGVDNNSDDVPSTSYI